MDAVNPKLFWASLLWAIFVVFSVHALDFPGSVPDFERASGGGALLDVRPSFSEGAIHRRLESYGEKGRRNYLRRNLTVDLILPFSVLPFFLLLMQRGMSRLRPSRATRALLLSLPVAYVAFDLAENGCVIALLASFPGRLPSVAALLPFLTVIKRAASMLAFVVPLGILAAVRLRAFGGGHR